MPSFLSSDNFRGLEVPQALKVAGGLGSVSLLAVLYVLIFTG